MSLETQCFRRRFAPVTPARDSESLFINRDAIGRGGMMARRGVLGVFAAAIGAAGLAGCGGLSPASYRFRMTVEVETPEGLRTGSSVYEVRARKNTGRIFAEENAGSTSISGEAVVVDIPSGPLFVLLKPQVAGQTLEGLATQALSGGKLFRNVDEFVAAVRSLGGWFGGAEAELPRADWPMIVRFRNIKDPKSVEAVDPDAIGVKRILLETTNGDVTTGIDKWLPDFGAASGFDSWYATLSMSDPRRVTLDDFRKGI